MTSQELDSFLTEAGVAADQVTFGDDVYVLPGREWLRTELVSAFRSLLKAVEAVTYAPGRNDCEDFERGAAWFAQVLHNRTPVEDASMQEAALAFGIFDFVREADGQAHAINCAVVFEGGDFKLVFFEPQFAARGLDPMITLSEGEMGNCREVRF